MKRHQRSFFGQKSGIILDSGDYDQEYVYFTFIKKISEDLWEKPSERQGKKVKLNLGELIMIRRVFMGIDTRWSTVHKFNDETTTITTSKDQNNPEQIWINVDSYRKNLRPPETEIFLLLIAHIIDEKIQFSTGFNSNYKEQIPYSNENSNPKTYKTENKTNEYQNTQRNQNHQQHQNHQQYQNHGESQNHRESAKNSNDPIIKQNTIKLEKGIHKMDNKETEKTEKKQYYCKTISR